ncbi:hypothetical protein LC605_13890 [Nostoc sp. CHAB 5836]|uniref:hypothetical protein n=1 Tax=Nostoc sp. CHAB 5836 TaxID=2780404 RepID=UPI001E2C821B|nr:hypothetical protein [Nostoc sp. CHAB 5836]MCC5616138.1 hypothetical protein [Nostoc sp. CHAB 5836]
MKPRLHSATTFNLKLIGAMPIVALSLVLFPAIVKAQPINENLFFSDSPSQVDKEVKDPDFSQNLENLSPNLSPTRGEALNYTHILGNSQQQFPPPGFSSTSSAATTDTSIPDVQPTEREIQPFQPATSVDLPRSLRKIAGIEDKKDERKNLKTQLPASPTKIQPFQPTTSLDLPRGLRKIAGVAEIPPSPSSPPSPHSLVPFCKV